MVKGLFHHRKRYLTIGLYDETVDVCLVGGMNDCLALLGSLRFNRLIKLYLRIFVLFLSKTFIRTIILVEDGEFYEII